MIISTMIWRSARGVNNRAAIPGRSGTWVTVIFAWSRCRSRRTPLPFPYPYPPWLPVSRPHPRRWTLHRRARHIFWPSRQILGGAPWPCPGHLEHFIVRDLLETLGLAAQAGVGGIDAVHIRIGFADVGLRAAARATALVSDPPRPRVVMSPFSSTP
jgi:hypothetical protein